VTSASRSAFWLPLMGIVGTLSTRSTTS